MSDFVLGMNAGLYQGAEGVILLASMDEVAHVKDVTLNLEAGEADITTRANSGWEATAPTLKKCTVDFQILWKPGDAIFDAIKTAFLASATLAFAILDQKSSIVGAQGPLGDFSITNFSRGESLTDAIVADVTLKLARFEEWHEVPA